MKIISLLILYATAYSVFGQDVKSGLIVGSSGSGIANAVSLSWTIGQPIIKNFTNGNGSLSSGNQQTDVKMLVTAVTDKNTAAFQIQAYPNPAQDQVTITFDAPLTATSTYDLISSDGTCIASGTALTNNQLVDVSSLASGMYVLNVYINHSIQSFKIVKQ